MGLLDNLATAKETTAITNGFSPAEIKTIIDLARISSQIEMCRREMGMTQKEFADYMGVSQGMVSKWESRDYNFTIKSLNEICHKLNLEFTANIEKPCLCADYKIIKWDTDSVLETKAKKMAWKPVLYDGEAIA